MPTAQRQLTPDQLERLARRKEFELDGGKLVRREMSNLSTAIGGIIYAMLLEFAQRSGAGFPFSDNIVYRCFPDEPTRQRKPDVSWFVKARVPTPVGDDDFTAAPDLIVEVISPKERAAKTEKKIQQFFAAGTSEAWVVYPDVNILHRRFADGRNDRSFRVNEILDGAPLLPGFTFKLADVLAMLP